MKANTASATPVHPGRVETLKFNRIYDSARTRRWITVASKYALDKQTETDGRIERGDKGENKKSIHLWLQ